MLTPKVVITFVSEPIVDCNAGIFKVYVDYIGKSSITKNDLKICGEFYE